MPFVGLPGARHAFSSLVDQSPEGSAPLEADAAARSVCVCVVVGHAPAYSQSTVPLRSPRRAKSPLPAAAPSALCRTYSMRMAHIRVNSCKRCRGCAQSTPHSDLYLTKLCARCVYGCVMAGGSRSAVALLSLATLARLLLCTCGARTDGDVPAIVFLKTHKTGSVRALPCRAAPWRAAALAKRAGAKASFCGHTARRMKRLPGFSRPSGGQGRIIMSRSQSL